jgi:hypothetical protein
MLAKDRVHEGGQLTLLCLSLQHEVKNLHDQDEQLRGERVPLS